VAAADVLNESVPGDDDSSASVYVPDTFWLIVAVLLFAACGLVWLIGQVAAISSAPTSTYRSGWSTCSASFSACRRLRGVGRLSTAVGSVLTGPTPCSVAT
jgi:hypothetical protein